MWAIPDINIASNSDSRITLRVDPMQVLFNGTSNGANMGLQICPGFSRLTMLRSIGPPQFYYGDELEFEKVNGRMKATHG